MPVRIAIQLCMEAAEIQNGPRYLSRRDPWLRTARSIGDLNFSIKGKKLIAPKKEVQHRALLQPDYYANTMQVT